MSKFGLDYTDLASKITKKASFRLSDVKEQLEVVAFDIVRFKDADKGADLWQVQSADDGDYIVALYNEEETIEKKASALSYWTVLTTKNGSDLQISYKGDPIVRLSSAKLGIPSNEIHLAEHYLPERLAESKQLVKALLSELNEVARLEVAKRYPELV